jgi:hypothetical protein
MVVSLAVVLAVMLLSGGRLRTWAADSLDLVRARAVLLQLLGANLKPDQIRIKSLKPGPVGDSVIVEAQVETAFRFAPAGRNSKEWRVAEMRFGDRQWESIELIDEAVRREKIRRTSGQLEIIAAGIDNYRRARGTYVATQEIGKLLDELVPNYLKTLVPYDLWGTPFGYQGDVAHYRLSSAGPDRQLGTEDDLIVADGVLKPVGN